MISPLLANIYLHYALDPWAHQWRKQHATSDVIVVRYADDSVFGFGTKETAQRFLQALRIRLTTFGLCLHSGTTRLIEFGRFATKRRRKRERGQGRPETFDFLGFTHGCGTSRTDEFRLLSLTVKKRMRATLAGIREKLMRRRLETLDTVGPWLHRVMQGYFNHYAIPGSLIRLEGLRSEVCRAWRHALLRRSQRHRMPWDRFNRLARRYVPYSRQVHPHPTQRFAASRS